jgi:repressor of nif and glnA expression
MYKVTYNTKSKDGYLVNNVSKFDKFQDVVNFLRSLQSKKIVGRPTIEKA